MYSCFVRPQRLVQEGTLKLVLWREMALPRRASEKPEMSTRYAHQVSAVSLHASPWVTVSLSGQIIIYNHGVLALLAEDTVVIAADVDEYMLTPKPTTVKQVG